MIRFLILDGADGTGTSTHADALADALRDRGIVASAYHHPRHPAGFDGAARVAWYAGARAQLAAEWRRLGDVLAVCEDDSPRVVVLDRGPLSGVAYAMAHAPDAAALAWQGVEAWERAAGECPAAWLDAADDALDARLAARGEDVRGAWPERAAWRALAAERGLRRFDTGGERGAVGRELAAWAAGVLR